MRSSRIDTTRLLVDSIIRVPKRPMTLINASGVGFYGPQDDRPISEGALAGNGFLADLCVEWEREANRAEEYGLRVLNLRIGMVLGKNGGALSKMVLPFRLFFGGPIFTGDSTRILDPSRRLVTTHRMASWPITRFWPRQRRCARVCNHE